MHHNILIRREMTAGRERFCRRWEQNDNVKMPIIYHRREGEKTKRLLLERRILIFTIIISRNIISHLLLLFSLEYQSRESKFCSLLICIKCIRSQYHQHPMIIILILMKHKSEERTDAAEVVTETLMHPMSLWIFV